VIPVATLRNKKSDLVSKCTKIAYWYVDIITWQQYNSWFRVKFIIKITI